MCAMCPPVSYFPDPGVVRTGVPDLIWVESNIRDGEQVNRSL